MYPVMQELLDDRAAPQPGQTITEICATWFVGNQKQSMTVLSVATIYDCKILKGIRNVPMRFFKPGSATAQLIGIDRTFYLLGTLFIAFLAFPAQRNF